MLRPIGTLRPLLALALVSGVFADDPGSHERGQVAWKMKDFDQKLGEILDRAQRWKADGKLEDEQKRRDLIGQINNLIEPITENYSEAVAAGMPPSDPVLAGAKAKLDETFPKLEPLGFWTCWRAEEPRIEEVDQLDNGRRVADEATWEATKGRIEASRSTWKGVERITDQLLRQSRDKPDNPGSRATPNLDQTPAFKRYAAEIERLKAVCEPLYQKADALREATAKDWQTAYEAMQKIHQGAGGSLKNTLDSRSSCDPETLAKLEDFEKNLRPGIQKTMADLAAKYPVTDQDKVRKIIDEVFGDTWRDYESKYHLGSGLTYTYKELTELCAAPEEIRKECAGRLGAEASRELADLGQYAEGAITSVMVRVNEKVELGLRFDPTHPEVLKAKATMAPREAELRAAIEKATDEARLPPSVEKFDGPGTVAELQAAAVEFFNNHSDWGRAENPYLVQAVSITGQWDTEEKNLIGETIQWYVPFAAAFTRGTPKEPGVAYIYEGRLMTKEERGIAKAPPFGGYAHGDSRKMRIANLPGGGAGAGGFLSGSGAGGGMMGQYFWLGLVLVNLVAGLLAAGPLLRTKVPQLEPVYAGLAPLSALVGVAALAVGLLCFLRATLFWFSPVADLLPQAAAVLAGLFLGKEILLKKPAEAGPTAPAPATAPAPEAGAAAPAAPGEPTGQQKVEAAAAAAAESAQKAALAAQELLIKHREKIEALEKIQVPIGIACLVLGLLHLLAPGIALL